MSLYYVRRLNGTATVLTNATNPSNSSNPPAVSSTNDDNNNDSVDGSKIFQLVVIGVVLYMIGICLYEFVRILLCKRHEILSPNSTNTGTPDETILVHDGRVFSLSPTQRRAILEVIFKETSQPVTDQLLSKKKRKRKKTLEEMRTPKKSMEVDVDESSDRISDDNDEEADLPKDVEIPILSSFGTETPTVTSTNDSSPPPTVSNAVVAFYSSPQGEGSSKHSSSLQQQIDQPFLSRSRSRSGDYIPSFDLNDDYETDEEHFPHLDVSYIVEPPVQSPYFHHNNNNSPTPTSPSRLEPKSNTQKSPTAVQDGSYGGERKDQSLKRKLHYGKDLFRNDIRPSDDHHVIKATLDSSLDVPNLNSPRKTACLTLFDSVKLHQGRRHSTGNLSNTTILRFQSVLTYPTSISKSSSSIMVSSDHTPRGGFQRRTTIATGSTRLPTRSRSRRSSNESSAKNFTNKSSLIALPPLSPLSPTVLQADSETSRNGQNPTTNNVSTSVQPIMDAGDFAPLESLYSNDSLEFIVESSSPFLPNPSLFDRAITFPAYNGGDEGLVYDEEDSTDCLENGDVIEKFASTLMGYSDGIMNPSDLSGLRILRKKRAKSYTIPENQPIVESSYDFGEEEDEIYMSTHTSESTFQQNHPLATTPVAKNCFRISNALVTPESEENNEELSPAVARFYEAYGESFDEDEIVELNRTISMQKRESFSTIASEYTYDDDSTTGENVCSICLCGYEKGDVLVASKYCIHVFHKDCLLEWLEKHNECPICRVGMITPMELNRAATSLVAEAGMDQALGSIDSSRHNNTPHAIRMRLRQRYEQQLRAQQQLDQMAAGNFNAASRPSSSPRIGGQHNVRNSSSLNFVGILRS